MPDLNLRFALLFMVLALSVQFLGLNRALFLDLHHAATVLPGACWRVMSMFGEWLVVIALLLQLGAREPQRLPSLLLAGVAGVGAAILLKAGFDVPRPSLVLPAGSVHLLDVLPVNASFPSGHALAIALLAGMVAGGRSLSLQFAAFVLVWLVCLSRLAIGVHWPLDVLAGSALGYALAGGIERLHLPRWPARLSRWLVRLLAVVLLFVALRQSMQAWPNTEYGLFHLFAAAMAILLLRPTKNGA